MSSSMCIITAAYGKSSFSVTASMIGILIESRSPSLMPRYAAINTESGLNSLIAVYLDNLTRSDLEMMVAIFYAISIE